MSGTFEWRDLVIVASGCSTVEDVFRVIKGLGATGGAASVPGFMHHHFGELGSIMTGKGAVEFRVETAEEPWPASPCVQRSVLRLSERAEFGVRTLSRLQVSADAAAGTALANGCLALVRRVADPVRGAPGHVPSDQQRVAPYRALLVWVPPPPEAGIEERANGTVRAGGRARARHRVSFRPSDGTPRRA